MQNNIYKAVDISNLNRDEWLESRNNSIGGSEAGCIMGVNPYQSALELFEKKSRLYDSEFETNEAMFFGNLFEDKIRDFMRYWDTDFETSERNFRNGDKVRMIYNPTRMFYSQMYPFMSANLDGLIMSSPSKPEAVLEIKTMSGYVHDKYETGIPPYHFFQLQHYLAVMGLDYGLLAMVIDNRKVEVVKFQRDRALLGQLIQQEQKFWKYVTNAREAIKEHGLEKARSLVEYPPVDGSDGTRDYLKERFKNPDDNTMNGTPELLKEANKILEIKEEMKEKRQIVQEIENKIKFQMGDEYDKIDFGTAGHISWRANKNGVRTFLNKIKI